MFEVGYPFCIFCALIEVDCWEPEKASEPVICKSFVVLKDEPVGANIPAEAPSKLPILLEKLPLAKSNLLLVVSLSDTRVEKEELAVVKAPLIAVLAAVPNWLPLIVPVVSVAKSIGPKDICWPDIDRKSWEAVFNVTSPVFVPDILPSPILPASTLPNLALILWLYAFLDVFILWLSCVNEPLISTAICADELITGKPLEIILPVMLNEPVNSWVSSKVSPNMVLPALNDCVMTLTEDDIINLLAIKSSETIRLPVILESPPIDIPANCGTLVVPTLCIVPFPTNKLEVDSKLSVRDDSEEDTLTIFGTLIPVIFKLPIVPFDAVIFALISIDPVSCKLLVVA